jgi:hypothetical protein
MGKKYVSAYVETEVDVDLEDFAIEDLIDHVKENGYVVTSKNDSNKFIFTVQQLYSTWRTCDGKIFEKELCEFFSEILEKDIRP